MMTLILYWSKKPTHYLRLMSVGQSQIFKIKQNKTGVINDPLGKPTVPAGSDCRLILKFWDGRTDTLCEIVITTGRDCGRPRGSIDFRCRSAGRVWVGLGDHWRQLLSCYLWFTGWFQLWTEKLGNWKIWMNFRRLLKEPVSMCHWTKPPENLIP